MEIPTYLWLLVTYLGIFLLIGFAMIDWIFPMPGKKDDLFLIRSEYILGGFIMSSAIMAGTFWGIVGVVAGAVSGYRLAILKQSKEERNE